MTLLRPLLAALFLAWAAPAALADNAPAVPVVSWDRTETVRLLRRLPRKSVSYTVESKKTVLTMAYRDILALVIPRGNHKYTGRELSAKIQRRITVYDDVDITRIPEVPLDDAYVLELIQPLLRAGRVAVTGAGSKRPFTSLTIRDHGRKQGDTFLDGSVDYVLFDGTVIASTPYAKSSAQTTTSTYYR
ncbi:MAG: hypothetical protein PHW10_01150 [Candidatus Peribacteraceae bacterium]|nr:hypothetical protein [Candidatus Peribacteraceae bacterium]